MTVRVWQMLIAAILGLHGIGHVLFLLPSWGIAKFEDVSGRSWLLTPLLGEKWARALGGLLWLVVIVGFVAAALGILDILVPPAWWRTLAVASAALALFGMALYWDGVGRSTRYAPGLADVGILVALLVAHWPTVALVGS
jgi:hypothetical protein